jgi:hypothetical protein
VGVAGEAAKVAGVAAGVGTEVVRARHGLRQRAGLFRRWEGTPLAERARMAKVLRPGGAIIRRPPAGNCFCHLPRPWAKASC